MDNPKTAQMSFRLTINKGSFQTLKTTVSRALSTLNRFDQKLHPVCFTIRCLNPFQSRVRLVQKACGHR